MNKERFKLKEEEYALIPILIFAIILIIPTVDILSNGPNAKVRYISLIGEIVSLIRELVSGNKTSYFNNIDSRVKLLGIAQLLNLLAIIIIDILALFLGRKEKKAGFLFILLGILAFLGIDDKWFDFWTFSSLVILVCSWGINVVRRINRKANKAAKRELEKEKK